MTNIRPIDHAFWLKVQQDFADDPESCLICFTSDVFARAWNRLSSQQEILRLARLWDHMQTGGALEIGRHNCLFPAIGSEAKDREYRLAFLKWAVAVTAPVPDLSPGSPWLEAVLSEYLGHPGCIHICFASPTFARAWASWAGRPAISSLAKEWCGIQTAFPGLEVSELDGDEPSLFLHFADTTPQRMTDCRTAFLQWACGSGRAGGGDPCESMPPPTAVPAGLSVPPPAPPAPAPVGRQSLRTGSLPVPRLVGTSHPQPAS